MGVDLRGRDVGMDEQRLDDAKVSPARSDQSSRSSPCLRYPSPVGRDAGVGRHGPDDLVEADPAKMRFAAREQPERGGRHVLAPALDRLLGARRDGDEAFLRSLAAKDQEWLADAKRAPGQAYELRGPQPRAVEELEK